jgi:hypothetical protein
MSKCLANSNKSRAGNKETKKRFGQSTDIENSMNYFEHGVVRIGTAVVAFLVLVLVYYFFLDHPPRRGIAWFAGAVATKAMVICTISGAVCLLVGLVSYLISKS